MFWVGIVYLGGIESQRLLEYDDVKTWLWIPPNYWQNMQNITLLQGCLSMKTCHDCGLAFEGQYKIVTGKY